MKPIIQDKNFKVLIVDDDPINIQIVASILQKDGYRMTFASNGKKALEKAHENNLDLILLDILMPEMDGFEVCRKLKESPASVDIPVIFLTVKDDVEEIIMGFELGAVDYVTKPFNADELLARVRAHVKSKKVRDSQDIIISKLKTTLDERKRAEDALKKAEEKYRSIFENAIEGIFQTTLDGRYIQMNPAFASMFGYASPEEMIAQVVDIGKQLYVNPMERERLKDILSNRGYVKGFEAEQRRKDGTRFWISINAHSVRDADGTILYYEGTNVDITDRKRMEEELLRSQKLESISILAGGIAHDFNNLLGAITGYIGLTKIYMNSEDAAYRNLEKAEQACLRASELTRQLITFSYGGEYLQKEISLAELLKDLCCFILGGSNVRCDLSLPDDLWPIMADARQVRQVVQHLLKNAMEAMPEGGVINIRAMNRTVAKDDGMPLKDGKYVAWYVEDHGFGIPKENLSKIFDPYFTTKGRDSTKGIGFGLAICYSVINRHKGLITVSSEPGSGTIFTVYLPAAVSDYAVTACAQDNTFGKDTPEGAPTY